MLARLVGKFEDREKSNYDFAKLPEADKYGRMDRLIGFEMEIELLEGKFKLGQQAKRSRSAGSLAEPGPGRLGALDAPIHRRFLQALEAGHRVARSERREFPAIPWVRRRRGAQHFGDVGWTRRTRLGVNRLTPRHFPAAEASVRVASARRDYPT